MRAFLILGASSYCLSGLPIRLALNTIMCQENHLEFKSSQNNYWIIKKKKKKCDGFKWKDHIKNKWKLKDWNENEKSWWTWNKPKLKGFICYIISTFIIFLFLDLVFFFIMCWQNSQTHCGARTREALISHKHGRPRGLGCPNPI